jgi:hypothetical protein
MSWRFQVCRIEWTAAGETVTCIDVGSHVYDYFPASPALRVDSTQGRRRGSMPLGHSALNVMESVRVGFSPAAFWNGVRALESAFERALLWAESDRRDMRVVLRFRDLARHADWFEAPLYNGSITLDRGSHIGVSWERGPYWTGAETLLKVRNNWTQYGGDVTPDGNGFADYAQVTNADDDNPSHCNWVVVEAPEGDVPAPARIRVQNNYDGDRLRTIYMGWNDRPQAMTLEGEDSETDISIHPNTAYSNQAYAVGDAFLWEMPQNAIRDFTGPFRVLANGDLSDGTWRVASGHELTRMQYGSRSAVTGANGWTDLGILSFPPGGYVHPVRYPVRVWLDGLADGSLDYLLLIPQRQSRTLQFRYYNCAQGACVEDDGWREELVYDFGGERLPIIDGFGDPVQLWPENLLPGDQEQMLTFALGDDRENAHAFRTGVVQVFARPHYRTLP